MKTILLVEDDYIDVMSVRRTLKKTQRDFNLEVAHNGEDALRLLRGSHSQRPINPDLILLDINMPKMNGIEFLSVIRKDPSLSHLKVFIMTTSSEEKDRRQAESLHVNGYIIKPLDFDNFSSKSSMENFQLLLSLLE